MDVLKSNEPFYFNSLLEVKTIEQVIDATFEVEHNSIVLIIMGNIKYRFNNGLQMELKKGEMKVLRCGDFYEYSVAKSCKLLFIRITNAIPLIDCNNMLEQLLHEDSMHAAKLDNNGKLQMGNELWLFVNSLLGFIKDGINSKLIYDLKIKEFFHILWIYYTKEELSLFFRQIISSDMIFSSFVMENYQKLKSIKAFAGELNCTPQTFSKKFKAIFGQTAYKWLKTKKSEVILRKIVTTKKLFKEIANEYDYSTQHLNNYCRREFGDNPSRIRKKGKFDC